MDLSLLAKIELLKQNNIIIFSMLALPKGKDKRCHPPLHALRLISSSCQYRSYIFSIGMLEANCPTSVSTLLYKNGITLFIKISRYFMISLKICILSIYKVIREKYLYLFFDFLWLFCVLR